MATRFRRTMKIAPGLRLNLGKRGVSLTAGGKLGRVTVGPSGAHLGASVPGTGLYMTEKVDSAQPGPGSWADAAPTGPPQPGNVKALLRGIPPREPGTSGFFAAISGSAKRKALHAIDRAAASLSAESDATVAAVAEEFPDSWTIRREAGLYFVQRNEAPAALAHLSAAANLFPGDRTLYYVVAADIAIDAGDYRYAIGALERYVSSADPESDVGALILTTLASACLKSGDPTRSLELLSRLPLRRKYLGDTLLYALCVRARANRATGQKAQAKKDIDRVYAHEPDFPLLEEASREALAD
jgi:tetratricopeptide (TPR) repeat protein